MPEENKVSRPAKKKFVAKKRFGYSSGVAEVGDVVDLSSKEAKYFVGHDAIGPYIEDDSEDGEE